MISLRELETQLICVPLTSTCFVNCVQIMAHFCSRVIVFFSPRCDRLKKKKKIHYHDASVSLFCYFPQPLCTMHNSVRHVYMFHRIEDIISQLEVVFFSNSYICIWQYRGVSNVNSFNTITQVSRRLICASTRGSWSHWPPTSPLFGVQIALISPSCHISPAHPVSPRLFFYLLQISPLRFDMLLLLKQAQPCPRRFLSYCCMSPSSDTVYCIAVYSIYYNIVWSPSGSQEGGEP